MTRHAIGYLWMSVDHFRRTSALMGALAAFGVWMVVALPVDHTAPYVPILFCQLFGASTGFRELANLGQFDRLLVDGTGRGRLGLCHYVLSTAPGWGAWLLVSGWQLWRVGTSLGLSVPSFAAMLLVSTIAWAATLPTSRLVGGAVWVVLMMTMGSSTQGADWIRMVLESSQPASPADGLHTLPVLVAVPFLFLVPSAEPTAGSWPVASGTAALVPCV